MEAKAVLGIVLGLVYVAIGVFVLRAAMDERAWIKKSGAAEMMDEL